MKNDSKPRGFGFGICISTVLLLIWVIAGVFFSPALSYAQDEYPDRIVDLTESELNAVDSGKQGDYFTIDSTPDDVRRVEGEPDEMFDDGRRKVWYYGKDAVYFTYYGKVVGVDNNSGKLKFQ